MSENQYPDKIKAGEFIKPDEAHALISSFTNARKSFLDKNLGITDGVFFDKEFLLEFLKKSNHHGVNFNFGVTKDNRITVVLQGVDKPGNAIPVHPEATVATAPANAAVPAAEAHALQPASQAGSSGYANRGAQYP